MSIKTAVVPVAGLGTRLLPISQAVPKELLPLGRKPALQHVAEELATNGVTRIVLVTSPGKPMVDRLFRPDQRLDDRLAQTGKQSLLKSLWWHQPFADIEVQIVIQDEQLGLGHAILCAESACDRQPFAVALGDCLIGLPGTSTILNRLIRVFEEGGSENGSPAAVIAFEEVSREQVGRFGIADPQSDDDVFRLHDIVEKPSIEEAPSCLAVAARYVFAPQIFDSLHQTGRGVGNEIQLTDAVREMIREGQTVWGVRLRQDEPRFDVGDLQEYVSAFVRFAFQDPGLRQSVLQAIKLEECEH